MKSFFKKIALVLVLAMVVTMLPAKAVSAADADGPQLSKQVKLYIGGDKSGSYSESAYAKVWNKTGYTVQFSSSDETVATVGKRYGLVTAVSVGEATITAVFTNEDGEKVTKTCPVVVKKNAVIAGISENSAKTLEEGITAGETFQPKVFRTSADGETSWKGKDVITDAARFTSSDPKVFTVAKTTGKITAVAAGEATLTVWAVQGEKPAEKDENGKVVEYLATTEKVEYPVKVVAGEPVIKEVTLKAVDTLVLSVANVTADNVKTLKVYNEVGGDITSLFKDPVLSDDKATVTVEKYINFVNDEKLSLVFGEGQAYEYTVKVGEAAALILEGPTTAVFSKETSISYRVVDEFGTDLKKSGVSFEVTDPTYAFVDSDNAKITMYQLGATVVLKGTYNTGKVDDNWNPILLTSEIGVTCVEESAVNVSGTKFGFALDKLTNDDLVMYVKDVDLRLYAEVTLSNDTKVNSRDAFGSFTFEALTPSVLLVDAGTGVLAPVANGIARILVKCNYEGVTSTAVAVINVRPNPEEAAISVEYNGSTAISNSVSVGESVTATIKGTDQYGDKYNPTIKDIECLAAPTAEDKAAGKGYLAQDGASLTFAGAGRTKGAYTYRVTTNGNHSVIISVTVNEPSTDDVSKAVSYKVQITSGTTKEIDPANVADETCGDVTFRIIGLDNKGVAIGVVPTDKVTGIEIPDRNENWVVTGSNEYVVHFAEKADEATGSAIIVNLTDGYNVKTGTFTIKANVKVSDTVTRVAVPANVTVSVKASAPSYTIKSAAVKAASAAKADYEKAIMEQFVIGNDDVKYKGIAPYLGDVVTSIQSTGTSYVLVKNIKVYEKVGDSNNYVLHTINVNRYFSVTVGE